MLKSCLKFLVELTGNRFISQLLIRFTNSKWSRMLVPVFAKVYSINQEEMKKPLSDYQSLHQLFIRKLKPDCRSVYPHKNSIVSPVDGVISDFGSVRDVEDYKIKNKQIILEEMLGSKEKADIYRNGKYIVLYLSPRHYHRIHSPVNGKINGSWVLGSKSYPVNSIGFKYGNSPLSTNYRRITEIQSELGKIAVVKVGALNVNSIHLTCRSEHINSGEELGYFSFGSTVVLFIEKADFQFSTDITTNQDIQFGKKLGAISDSLFT
ncbi:phosphatidylserine decarboxylase [Virgibacillus pantothenticus]|uniref:phosphatidylserine decarboxylase n=1 Tax=Virgibacillus pantothenticus TaxID=1473 RepID=UPI001C2397FB|nr:phosphatidylserine decarboxylase [Virgibacillus pantothenticus]MBU8568653.1 phosphatidylserine decarboxylase [Virgibacillus pantothenticus]MBU8602678.1 phosphatidylserine decarboxylase [Virgibacillus pantothenticus]MBU8636784.1 phosphatidylserine decarboxylase [Virgibacillus pantothenticus]MBU8644521.1 phosphatidylserine decarboxylase [Virgibacillus pantothenticus]MBU8648603.1 phosphatidylserine decarboxylase [Virgibacillus pantothenticus]